MPSHRALAMLRGRNEGVLDLDLDVTHEAGKPHPAEAKISGRLRHRRPRPARRQVAGRDGAAGLEGAAAPSLTADLLARLKERADGEAISVFSKEPEGSAAGRAGRPARHHGARSRHPHRRQGRRGGPDRQGRRHRRPSIRTSRASDWQGSLAALAALCMQAQGRS